MAVFASTGTKVPENAPGTFGVLDTCIDCDLCRQTAPEFFKRQHIGNAGHSFVYRQPATDQEAALCAEALQACPVEAIVCDEDLF